MKVFITEDGDDSYAIRRIKRALISFAPPGVHFVQAINEADLALINVVGRYDHVVRLTERLLSEGKEYCMLQYVLHSTKQKDPLKWARLWKKARLTWSYLPLDMYVPGGGFRLYLSPLGVDSVFFRKKSVKVRRYIMLSTGSSFLTESVREIYHAARGVGKEVAHVGASFPRDGMSCFQSISDNELRELYQQCKYVSGLRRIEGFELPAAEGLLCGARPILFDQPHYRLWYGDFAEYIPETNREGVIRNLQKIFSSPYRKVTALEIEEARKVFDWKKIMTEFWRRV